MNAIKKYMFYIVLAVVLLVTIALYLVFSASVENDKGVALGVCKEKQESLEKLKKNAMRPDYIITQEHVNRAKAYSNSVDAQLKEVNEVLASKGKLDLREDPPSLENRVLFDSWLMQKVRPEIKKKIDDAGLDVSQANMAELLFEASTDNLSSDPTRHADFRVRHLAITDEIISILTGVKARVKAPTDQPDEDKDVDLKVQALEKLVIKDKDEKEILSSTAGPRGEAEASKWVGKVVKPASSAPALPYRFVPVTLQIVTPFGLLPELIKALETSNRFLAVVTRLDFQRAVLPYPTTLGEAAPMAGPDPKFKVNTFYLEGPVRVELELDLCEYGFDKAKMDAFKKMAGVK